LTVLCSRILESGVDQNRRRAAVETLFQVFFGDPQDGHAPVL
jgi:hypothetical protein